MQGKKPAAVILWLAVCFTLVLSASAQAQPLTPVAGSPFISYAASGSGVPLLSPDEKHLFVSNQYSDTITVWNVAPDGSLTLQGTYPTDGFPIGMITNPAGTVLYLTGFAGATEIEVFSVADDGTLTRMQGFYPISPVNLASGNVYWPRADGDILYINKGVWPANKIGAVTVNPDGTLGTETEYDTGGSSAYMFWASPSLLTSGGRLFAINGGPWSDPPTGSNDISVFDIAADGSLSPVAGSPFPLPAGDSSSGGMAINPAGTFLFAGMKNSRVAKYSIGADGSLSLVGATNLENCGVTPRGPNAMMVRSAGDFLLATLPSFDTNLPDRIAVINTETMNPVQGSPVTSQSSVVEGAVINKAGTLLFTGFNNWWNNITLASVYQFSPQPDAALDTTPPITTYSVSFNTCEATVALSASDPGGCGQITTYYRLNSGPAYVYYGPFTSGQRGDNIVEYWSVDAAGNEELPHNFATFTISDVLAPITSITLVSCVGCSSPPSQINGWYIGTVVARLHVFDQDSCFVHNYWILDGGATQQSSGNNPWDEWVSVSSNGSHTLEYWAVDPVGNESIHQFATFQIDKAPPTITFSTTVAKEKGVPVATITGKLTDTGSGPDVSSATFNVYDEYGLIHPSGPVPVKADGTFSFKVTLGAPKGTDKDGREFQIQIKASDLAGNSGSAAARVVVK